jgi:NADPH:quinone reductase-like Zn-dependent oxidoreductase
MAKQTLLTNGHRVYGRTMKSLWITAFGGPEKLQIRESPNPLPGPGQVVIEVERAGLNFADIMGRVGLYLDAPKPPMVMGYEVAGRVAAVGAEVRDVRPADRVVAITRFRGHANRVLVDGTQAIKIPEKMSFDQAAALPVNYLTAYHMLFHVGHLRPFDKVLIHMAAGGVGLAAIQLCRTVEGVEIFGTASSTKHDYLRQAGVQHPIDYRSMEYAPEVRRLTAGKGVQLILDPLGGKNWSKGYQLLAPTGQLIAFGWSSLVSGERRNYLRVISELLSMKRFSPISLMNDNRTVSGVNLLHLWKERELLSREMSALLRLFEEGKIAPHVDRVFPLSAGAEAHRYIQERRNIGKVLFDCTAT